MSEEWKEDKKVHFVTNDFGKSMWFRLSPAKINPESAPIFLILHGHGTTSRPTFYAEQNWNVIAPIDNFGLDNKGSWWIGENGDCSTSDLLENVVLESKKLLNLKENVVLCIYGSSMGGYGAVLNGFKLKAKAVYANVPQVKLLGSTYSELGMKKYFEAALGQTPKEEHNDLNLFVKSQNDECPLFFICENRFGQRDYLEQQAMTFVKTLTEINANFHLEIVPTKGHNKNLGLREVRALFEKFLPELNYLEDGHQAA